MTLKRYTKAIVALAVSVVALVGTLWALDPNTTEEILAVLVAVGNVVGVYAATNAP